MEGFGRDVVSKTSSTLTLSIPHFIVVDAFKLLGFHVDFNCVIGFFIGFFQRCTTIDVIYDVRRTFKGFTSHA